VYEALPEAVRGAFVTRRNALDPDRLTVVSSYGDLISLRGQPAVFFEHGAGFRYNVNHPSYAGSGKRDGVVLFCNVNQFVAERNEAAHPNVKSAIVGCPKLDYLASMTAPTAPTPHVAFSWHWECRVAPETRSAWPHYKPDLGKIAKANQNLWVPLGHAHPKAWSTVRWDYARWGWTVARKFDDVCRRASVYVCDNSSTIYEFAALGRPVVVLNAPWYRKTEHHGLRFWDHIPGIQVDHPCDLEGAVKVALTDDTWAEKRREITGLVYPHLGSAAKVAAEAILGIL